MVLLASKIARAGLIGMNDLLPDKDCKRFRHLHDHIHEFHLNTTEDNISFASDLSFFPLLLADTRFSGRVIALGSSVLIFSLCKKKKNLGGLAFTFTFSHLSDRSKEEEKVLYPHTENGTRDGFECVLVREDGCFDMTV